MSCEITRTWGTYNRLNGAELLIDGARFIIDRIYINQKPTTIFKFRALSVFVDNDYSKNLITINWDVKPLELINVGKELGLDYHIGNLYKDDKPHFIEA